MPPDPRALPDRDDALDGLSVATFSPGPYATNCFVLRRPGGDACVIIDAGFEPERMLDWIEGSGLKPAAILLTHTHVDHIAGLGDTHRRFPEAPILVHASERAWLADPVRNLSLASGMPVVAPEATGTLEDGATIEPGGIPLLVLHTPGHSPGGVTFYNERAGLAIVGDALFAGSIGRTDFPGSDLDTLAASIRSRLYTLPGATLALPGHGPATTIDREMKTNPFVPGDRTGSSGS